MELSPLLLGLKSAPSFDPSRRRFSAPELGDAGREAFENAGSNDDGFMTYADAEAVRLSDDSFLMYAAAEAVRLKTPQLTPREAPEGVHRQEASMLREGLEGEPCPAAGPQSAHLVTESLLYPGLARYRPLGPPSHRRITHGHSDGKGNGSQMTGVYSMGTPTTACLSS